MALWLVVLTVQKAMLYRSFGDSCPAVQPDKDPVRVDIPPGVDGMLVAEVVGEHLVGGHLVHVPQQRVGADGEFPCFACADEEPLAGIVETPGLVGRDLRDTAVRRRRRVRAHRRGVLRSRCRSFHVHVGRERGAGHQELAAAALRDPDALGVVAPGPAQAGRPPPRLPQQQDAGRGVGRAVLALVRHPDVQLTVAVGAAVVAGACARATGARHRAPVADKDITRDLELFMFALLLPHDF